MLLQARMPSELPRQTTNCSGRDHIPLVSPSQSMPFLQDIMQHRQPTPLDAWKPDSDTRQQGRMESNGNQAEAPAAQPSRQAADTNGGTARPDADAAEIQEALAVLAKATKKDRKKREKDKEKNKKGDLHAALIIWSCLSSSLLTEPQLNSADWQYRAQEVEEVKQVKERTNQGRATRQL